MFMWVYVVLLRECWVFMWVYVVLLRECCVFMWVYVVLLRESVVCSWGTGGPYELYYRDCLTFIVKLPPHLPAFQKNIYGGHVRAIYIHGCHVRAVYKDMWSFALNIHDGRVRAIYRYVHTWWSCARNIYTWR